MKILIVGGGGREHALAWRLSQDAGGHAILAAPGNPGIDTFGRSVPVKADDIAGLCALVARETPDLVVVGPEAALAGGLVDRLATMGTPAFGPTAAAAQLETSKAFAKDFCARQGVPTADYAVFDDAPAAKAHLAGREPPYVIKADGLAAGKGVVVAETRREADAAIDEALFLKKFGAAGARIVIEDFLPGEEASFFALCDGERAMFLGAAQDHKRAFDGDKGPNTGGMGAYAPPPIVDPALIDRAMLEIVRPVVRGMAQEGRPFRGVLFVGLMISNGKPKVVEFNARFGDPECQTLMPLIEGDFAESLLACAEGRLANASLRLSGEAAATVVLAAQGYPDLPLTGSIIRGEANAAALPGVRVFHAGTRRDEDGQLRAAGGRVLNVTAVGADLSEAIARAYAGVDAIDWPAGFCRRDIGWRALRG